MLVGRQGGVRVEAGRRRSAAPIHVTMRGAGDHNATVRRRRYSLSARTRHPAMTKNQRHDNAAFQAVAHASLYAFQAVTRASLYAFKAGACASLYAFKAVVSKVPILRTSRAVRTTVLSPTSNTRPFTSTSHTTQPAPSQPGTWVSVHTW